MILHGFLTMDNFYYSGALEHVVEIIKNRLYFGVTADHNLVIIKNTPNVYYFCIDDELLYTNYYYDFGPLNISCLYKYCVKLHSVLKNAQSGKRIIHYTSSDPNKRTNAAFLMGCYAILYLNMNPKQIYTLLLCAGGSYRNFVDASQGTAQYTIHLMDCFSAIQKASLLNFFNFLDFNFEEYDKNDRLENGDMNWLVPRKFLAFIGPTELEANYCHKPEFYVNYFLQNDIRTVIRLNNKVYDESTFQEVGIEHHQLFFPDGTTPPKAILLRFLQISETTAGAIAVHCKVRQKLEYFDFDYSNLVQAGLGRTGSLIGAYIVKHYRMTAREAIAWMRICRPGSVIGQQQGWLEKIESWLWRQGSQYRVRHYGEGDKIPRHRYGIYSIQWPKERERAIQAARKKRLMSVSPNNQMEQKNRQIQSAQLHHELPKKKLLQNPKHFAKIIPIPTVTAKILCRKKVEKDVSTETRQIKPRQSKVESVLIKNRDDNKLKINKSIFLRKRIDSEMQCNTQGDHLNRIKTLRKLNGGVYGKQSLTPVETRNIGVGC